MPSRTAWLSAQKKPKVMNGLSAKKDDELPEVVCGFKYLKMIPPNVIYVRLLVGLLNVEISLIFETIIVYLVQSDKYSLIILFGHIKAFI